VTTYNVQKILTEWRKYLAEQAGPSSEAYKQILKKQLKNYTLFRALADEGDADGIKKFMPEDDRKVLNLIVYPSRRVRGSIILPIKDRANAAQLLSYYYADNSQIVKRYNKVYKQLLGLDSKFTDEMKEAILDLGLDVLGFVADPFFGYGAVFDAINAARHLKSGNIPYALFSVFSIVPGVGDLVAKPVKYMFKVYNFAQGGLLKADQILAAAGYVEGEGWRMVTSPMGKASVAALGQLLQDKVIKGVQLVFNKGRGEGLFSQEDINKMNAQLKQFQKAEQKIKKALAGTT